jgi:hypothetical protein
MGGRDSKRARGGGGRKNRCGREGSLLFVCLIVLCKSGRLKYQPARASKAGGAPAKRKEEGNKRARDAVPNSIPELVGFLSSLGCYIRKQCPFCCLLLVPLKFRFPLLASLFARRRESRLANTSPLNGGAKTPYTQNKRYVRAPLCLFFSWGRNSGRRRPKIDGSGKILGPSPWLPCSPSFPSLPVSGPLPLSPFFAAFVCSLTPDSDSRRKQTQNAEYKKRIFGANLHYVPLSSICAMVAAATAASSKKPYPRPVDPLPLSPRSTCLLYLF